MSTNSRAGVSLDAARRLHVYVDGKDQGVAADNIPDPCYAMFDVCDHTVQVRIGFNCLFISPQRAVV